MTNSFVLFIIWVIIGVNSRLFEFIWNSHTNNEHTYFEIRIKRSSCFMINLFIFDDIRPATYLGPDRDLTLHDLTLI